MDSKFCCSICDKAFATNTNLRKHYRVKHNESSVPPKLRKGGGFGNFVCTACFLTFSHQSSLARHKSQCHENEKCERFPCPLDTCGLEFSQRKAVLQHVREVHVNEARSLIQDLQFDTHADFEVWLHEEECKSMYRYVKAYGCAENFSCTYICHRSGTYTPRGASIRRLKVQGSCKLGQNCSAFILCSKTSDGKFCITYQCGHKYHGPELCHINLLKEERTELAADLSRGVSVDALLDRIRDSVTLTLTRKCLISPEGRTLKLQGIFSDILKKVELLGNSEEDTNIYETIYKRMRDCNSLLDTNLPSINKNIGLPLEEPGPSNEKQCKQIRFYSKKPQRSSRNVCDVDYPTLDEGQDIIACLKGIAPIVNETADCNDHCYAVQK